MNKPIKGTEDSWLVTAGIKTLPIVEPLSKSQRQRGSRCADLSDRQRVIIYDAIETLVQSDKTLTLKEMYQRLLETGILKCKQTELLLSIGTIGRFVADIRVKLGVKDSREELKTRFATLKESGMRKSRIMNELSLSVYAYDFLLRKYSANKKEGIPETPSR